MLKKVLAALLLLLLAIPTWSQSAKTHWVDSVFQSLSQTEKIGQLMMITVPPDASAQDLLTIEEAIKSHEVGGVIFQQHTPVAQALVINRLQQLSPVPLLVGQDATWGLGTSLDSTLSMPRPLVLGALHNDSLVYRWGRLLASQLKQVGVNLCLGIMAEPYNNVLAYRSFGEDSRNISRKATALMEGLQHEGVLGCALGFPITGLSVVEVQHGVPVLQPTLDSAQVYPYRQLFGRGLAAIMPESPGFPLFYQSKNLSRKNQLTSGSLATLFTGGWIRRDLRYRGLAMVNISHVQVETDKYRAGEAEALAFQAGNDLLVNPQDIGSAIRKIKKLLRLNKVYRAQLDNSVRRILEAKFDAGLWHPRPLTTDNLVARLNLPEAVLLQQQLYQSAITIARNTRDVLPIRHLENKHFAYLTTDAASPNNTFYNYLNKYVGTAYFVANENTDLVELSDGLRDQEVIVVGVFPQTSKAMLQRLRRVLEQLPPTAHVVWCDFGHESFRDIAADLPTVITAYTNATPTLEGVPQVIFGALPAQGALPIRYGALPAGTGVATSSLQRLRYSLPVDAGMDAEWLQRIDTIAHEAIRIGATPGCQVLVARQGKVIYQKAFGYYTYDKKIPVTNETIYDLASVTKVSATLQTAMFMYERGLIDLRKKVSVYLPELKKSNKKDITLLDMLTHQSGLAPFIPMWNLTVKDSTFLPMYYSRIRSERYPLQVSPNLFAAPMIRDSVWGWIVRSKLGEKPARTPFSYRYSDLGFLILQHLAEKILNQPLDDFVHQNLYEPLGATTTGFNPLNRFSSTNIAPTEDDKIFRRTFISGTVHDERAAMMGGVAGHAGLFSNANDLAKLGQMLVQGGYYGGTQYYKPETVQYFSARQFQPSRRGIGWDKPAPGDWNSPTSLLVSPRTFGHTGFTGTCIWIDPEFDLVYIFLSNRVYPDRNNKLSNANIRSRIQDVIYQSIFRYSGHRGENFVGSL